jgi:general secretion pathway protein J
MQARTGHSEPGFTLIELLIAVAVFTLMAAMAYTGFGAVMASSEAQDEAADNLAELQTIYRLLREDVEQITNRPIRDELAGVEESLLAGSGDTPLSFTRAGTPNPIGLARSDLQRVYYRLDGNRLIRGYYAHLDRTPGTTVRERILTDRLEEVAARFLDSTGQWQLTWPPLQGAGQTEELPMAIELTVRLEDEEPVKWLFALPE